MTLNAGTVFLSLSSAYVVYWLHDCFFESKMLWIVQSSHFVQSFMLPIKDNDSFLSLRIFILYLKNSYTYLSLEFYYIALLDMHEKKSKINGLKYSQTLFISKVWFSWITSQFRIIKPMYQFNMYWDITSNDEVIFLERIL